MKPLRIHCFQHVDYENLGCIEEWCKKKGHRIAYTRLYKNEPLPGVDDFDWLIIMGGPMGVYEEEKYSWLVAEKKAIRTAIAQNKTVLGICLGSQLIAEALGAKVYRNAEKEIGWFDVSLTEEGKNEPLLSGMSKSAKVFHWHGDTFDLPQNAKHLLFSEICRNQAFLYRTNVLALQFHFEVTNQSIRAMVENGKHELTAGKYIQHENEILSQVNCVAQNNELMFRILDNMES